MRALAAAVALSAGVVLAGCAGSSPKLTAHYTTPPETTPGVSLESPRVQQIQLARASDPRVFGIFPARPGRKRCAIPEGGVHLKAAFFHGICTTSIHAAPTHEPALVVTFTETWKAGRHTWRVIEGEPLVTAGAKLHVLATHTSGATAPQYWK
jgi:hypothetical protein